MPRDKTAEDLGLLEGVVAKIEEDGRGYRATTTSGEELDGDQIETYVMKNAHRTRQAVKLFNTKSGGSQWRQVPMSEFDAVKNLTGTPAPGNISVREITSSNNFIRDVLDNAMDYKPTKLRISELHWKFAVRGVLRGRNMMATGPSGCGKTLLATSLARGLNRPFFYINLGATQDPRSTLIGNTHFDPTRGTYVSLSYFAHAIQIKNAVILLDEASRAHPDAQNILMPVLDETQRYLRVDEMVDTDTIGVADGVSFVLTANIGSEYSATRTLDRAFMDRCMVIEMEPLDYANEFENIRSTYPELSADIVHSIVSVAAETRKDIKTDDPRMGTIISTRATEEWASLVLDGFEFLEAAMVSVEPYFTTEGGADSPRSHLRKIMQKFVPGSGTAGPAVDPTGQSKTLWGTSV